MTTGVAWEGTDSETRVALPLGAAVALVRGGHVTHPAGADFLGLSYRAQGQIAGP